MSKIVLFKMVAFGLDLWKKCGIWGDIVAVRLKVRYLLLALAAVLVVAILIVINRNSIFNQLVQIGSYYVRIPRELTVRADTPVIVIESKNSSGVSFKPRKIYLGEIVFEKDKVPVGGIQILSYNHGALLPTPNHSEIVYETPVQGLITKAVLLSLRRTEPAASMDMSVKEENHLYLIFEKERVVYDIYACAGSPYAVPKNLIKIAKSFRLSENAEALKVVERFGRSLQEVNKLAPRNVCAELIKEYYGTMLTPALLAQWMAAPSQAPGRYGSSPWPDRIEIKGITRAEGDKYVVQGDIVEITSVPGEEWRTKVELAVEKHDGRWLIAKVILK